MNPDPLTNPTDRHRSQWAVPRITSTPPFRSGKSVPGADQFPRIITTILMAIGVVGTWCGLAWSDTLWVLHIAGKMIDGARLYVDVIEINPPLIFWLAMPIVRAARWLSVDSVAVFRIAMFMGLGGSLCLTAHYLRDAARPGRQWSTPVLALALFVAPGQANFGEREHVIVACVLPWLAFSVARFTRRVSTTEAAIIGCLAGVAVALKPFYAPLVIGVLAYEARAFGWRRVMRFGEHWGAAVLVAAYAAVVALRSPEFFALTREYGKLYWAFHRRPILDLLSTWDVLFGIGTLALYSAARLRQQRTGKQVWLDLLSVALVADLLALVIQGKGFTYHHYPALATALVLAAELAFTPRLRWRLLLGTAFIASSALLIVVRFADASGVLDSSEIEYHTMAAAIEAGGHPPSMLLLGPGGDMGAFRYMHYAHVEWASRWPFPWPLQSFYPEQVHGSGPPRYRPTEDRPAAESKFVSATLDDIAVRRPAVILIRLPGDGVLRLDCYAYFIREPRFRQLLAAYVEGPRAGPYRVFRRADLVRAANPSISREQIRRRAPATVASMFE
jgi:hypothetical protein